MFTQLFCGVQPTARALKVGARTVNKVVAGLTAFALIIALVPASLLVPQQAQAAAVTLYSENFDSPDNSGLTSIRWSSISGGSSGSRVVTSDDGLAVAAGGSGRGLLMEGSGDHANDPDKSGQRDVATHGYTALTIQYSRTVGTLGAGDSFVAQYSLDEGAAITLETLVASQTHALSPVFTINNPNRHSKLTISFFINGDSNADEAGVDNLVVTGDNPPLFYDGFESNDFATGGWVVGNTPSVTSSSGYVWTDNNNLTSGHAANLDANPNDSITKSISTVGYQNIHVRYARRVDNLASGEALQLQYSTDGTNFVSLHGDEQKPLEGISDVDGSFSALPASANNNPNFKVRFLVNGNSAGDDGYVDDVVVWGETLAVGSIAGQKFNDSNGNGVKDGIESGLAGWTITLTPGNLTDVTDVNGDFSFDNLSDGTYDLCETLQSGWYQTAPASGNACGAGVFARTVVVSGGAAMTSQNIGNAQYGKLQVSKDTSPDAQSDTFSITASSSNGGTVVGEATQNITDGQTVEYTVTNGTYSVVEGDEDGWSNTGNTCENVAVAPGQTQTCLLTNTKFATITVVKNTTGGNGTFDFSTTGGNGLPEDFQITTSGNTGTQTYEVLPGTYGISEDSESGWTLVDSSCTSGTLSNLVLASGDTVTCTFANSKLSSITIEKVTNPSGDDTEFSFAVTGPMSMSGAMSTDDDLVLSNLAVGEYTITEGSVTGWDFTSATCNEQEFANGGTLTLAAGEDVTCVFTNTKRGSITVTKYAEPDGSFGFTLTGGQTPATTTLSNGATHVFTNLTPGTYQLAETVPEGWTGEQSASCSLGQSSVDLNNLPLPAGGEITCVFNNTQYSVLSGRKFEDMNANGADDTDPGLSEWQITLTGTSTVQEGEETVEQSVTRNTTTGEGGAYSFGLLLPGTYKVCETLPSGWHQSLPSQATSSATSCDNGSTGYTFQISAGNTIIPGVNFGNYQFGSISGHKFNDEDADGVWQTEGEGSEPGLVEWTITLTKPDTTTVNAVTGQGGSYQFTQLVPGQYTIAEQQQENWSQTLPNDPDTYTVTVTSGGVVTGKDFGNVEGTSLTINKTVTPVRPDPESDITPEEQAFYSRAFNFVNGDEAIGSVTVHPGFTGSSTIIIAPGTYNLTESETGLPSRYTKGTLICVDQDEESIDPTNMTVATGDAIVCNITNTLDLSLVPVMYPASGTTWGLDDDWTVIVDPIENVNEYLFGFEQGDGDDKLKFENFRDEHTFDADGTYTLPEDQKSDFTAGPMNIVVRALIDGVYTVIQRIPVTIEEGSALTVSDVAVSNITDTSATVTWTTNLPATSRVVSDTTTHPTLGSAPNYDYSTSTVEADTAPRVTSHTVELTGLTAGTAYFLRGVSNAGTEKTSNQGSFTTTGGTTTPTPSGGGGGSITSTGPTGVDVQIQGGNNVTATNLTLLLTFGSDVTGIALSNTADFAGASFETPNPTRPWVISSGNGNHPIFARFRNSAGGTTDDSVVAVLSGSTTPGGNGSETPGTPGIPGGNTGGTPGTGGEVLGENTSNPPTGGTTGGNTGGTTGAGGTTGEVLGEAITTAEAPAETAEAETNTATTDDTAAQDTAAVTSGGVCAYTGWQQIFCWPWWLLILILIIIIALIWWWYTNQKKQA